MNSKIQYYLFLSLTILFSIPLIFFIFSNHNNSITILIYLILFATSGIFAYVNRDSTPDNKITRSIKLILPITILLGLLYYIAVNFS